MAYVTTVAHQLHYKMAGPINQPALLILHGFLGSCEDFPGVLPLLCKHFCCILPDLPGHGQTTSRPDVETDAYGFEETGRSLISLLNHLQIEKANLLGYSMGGRIALYLAHQYPARIARTILESASPGLRTAAQRQARIQKDEVIACQLETMPIQDFLTQWYKNPLFDSLQRYPKAVAAMLNRRQCNSPAELAKALRGLGTGQQASMWPHLGEMQLPLMLMFGAEDLKFVSICRDIARAYEKNNDKKAVQRQFDGCGHSIHLEIPEKEILEKEILEKAPALYADAILDFIKTTKEEMRQ